MSECEHGFALWSCTICGGIGKVDLSAAYHEWFKKHFVKLRGLYLPTGETYDRESALHDRRDFFTRTVASD